MEKQGLGLSLGSSICDGWWIEIGRNLETTSRLQRLEFIDGFASERAIDAIINGIRLNNTIENLLFAPRFQCPQGKLDELIEAVSTRSNLKQLWIRVETANQASRLLGGLNYSKVELFDLHVGALQMDNHFSDFIGSSKYLRTIHLDIDHATLDFARQLARGIFLNESIRKLILTAKRWDQIGVIILRAIQENKFITSVDIPLLGSCEEEAKMYATLNKLGRRFALDPNFPTELMPKVYSSTGSHLNALYYFLREKPLNFQC